MAHMPYAQHPKHRHTKEYQRGISFVPVAMSSCSTREQQRGLHKFTKDLVEKIIVRGRTTCRWHHQWLTRVHLEDGVWQARYALSVHFVVLENGHVLPVQERRWYRHARKVK